ncbi:MAG: hypothetical protein EZS28_016425 [Streblomastix strix]|uniref:Uncharacterized protein n=1 Tax=Streblomastix strix TaxID=222440 RepID=A0A5J4W0L4_9EUKA|nr:MAG: hypothetical protein EZS28_016425 [Streblomastix strix]
MSKKPETLLHWLNTLSDQDYYDVQTTKNVEGKDPIIHNYYGHIHKIVAKTSDKEPYIEFKALRYDEILKLKLDEITLFERDDRNKDNDTVTNIELRVTDNNLGANVQAVDSLIDWKKFRGADTSNPDNLNFNKLTPQKNGKSKHNNT